MAALNQEDILNYLESASVLELNELIKAIEEKFGVTAAAPVAVAAAPAAEEAAAPSTVTISLTDCGASKVGVIKIVRELTGKGLLEAKQLVDKLPAVIKENISVDEANEIKAKFVEAGASVEVK